MLVVVIILVVVIVLVLSLSLALGLFKIEKVEVEEAPEPDFVLPESEEPQAEAGEEPPPAEPVVDLDDGRSLKEKMDLTGILREPEVDSSVIFQALDEDVREEFDRLTDFQIGRGFWRDCQAMLTDAQEQGTLYAAASLDFDRFRFINSLKGMSIGDYVLTRFSQELPAAFPEGTMITRISADHFAAFFPVGSMDMFEVISVQIGEICEKIRADIALKSVLRVCMGVAVSDKDHDVRVLLGKANIARHCIKFSRIESWKLYDSSLITADLARESALDDYNENQYDDDFAIFFVPQQDLSIHRINGAEALVRWSCEAADGKTLAATVDKCMLPTNGCKVVYQVCKSMSRWRKSGKQVIPVCVSVPITDFFKEDFSDFVGRCLSEFQIESNELVIVVDASVIRVDRSIAATHLAKLRERGVRAGVDGIDISYTGLEFLADLPISVVKLHRSFASHIHQDEERQGAVRRMLSAAIAMGAQLMVEGVGTPEQAETLQELGVLTVQGQYCGWPVPADEFIHGLSNYVERFTGTVILDESAMHQGEYKLF